MTIEQRAAKLGAGARKGFMAKHSGRAPTMEHDSAAGEIDPVWNAAWQRLHLDGALDSERDACRQAWMDAYFFMAGVSAGG